MKSSYTFVNSGELTNVSSSWPHSSPGNNHMCVLSCFSHVWLFATPWTVAHQAPLSMGFSRKEYLSGLPCPPPGDLPNLGIEPKSLCLPHWQMGSLPPVPPGKPRNKHRLYISLLFNKILILSQSGLCNWLAKKSDLGALFPVMHLHSLHVYCFS